MRTVSGAEGVHAGPGGGEARRGEVRAGVGVEPGWAGPRAAAPCTLR